MEFNNTPDTSDDMVMLSTPAYGSDIPASQPIMDVAVRAVGAPPPNMTVTLDNPDGHLGFGEVAPSPAPTPQPASPLPTQPVTQPFALPTDHSWLHLPAVGLTASLDLADASVRVTGNIAGRAGGVVLDQLGATVFWLTNPSITVTAVGSYQLANNGAFYPVDANGQKTYTTTYSAQATISVLGMNPAAPQIQGLRVGIVQNLAGGSTETAGYTNPQLLQWLQNVQPGTKTSGPFFSTQTRTQRSLPLAKPHGT